MNITVLVGRLSQPAQIRTLPSGSDVLQLDLTVPGPAGQRSDSVPVSWIDPPAWALALDAGDEVVVLGRVRRFFFRSGAATQSRTDVLAEAVVRARRTKQATALVDRALDRLEQAVRAPAVAS